MAKVLVSLALLACLVFADEDSAFKVKSFSSLKLKGTVLQGYEASCGAAAMATVLGLYGKKTSEIEVLKVAPKSDMLSFAELTKIADTFGFQAAGYKINIDTFNKLRSPVIARVDNRENYAHFVVVVNHDGDFVGVFDPSFGYYVQSKKEFFEWWNEDSYGVILIVIPKISHSNSSIKLELPNKNLFIR